jgi:hypothetical protein
MKSYFYYFNGTLRKVWWWITTICDRLLALIVIAFKLSAWYTLRRMEQEWKVGRNILRVLVFLMLASATEAQAQDVPKEYPAAALQADACFTVGQTCTVSAPYTSAQTYSVTFSSMDGRWNYSPKNVFNKDISGNPGLWEEGSYACSGLSDPYTCAFKGTTPGNIGTVDDTPETIAGETLRFDLGTVIQSGVTISSMTFWASTDAEGGGGRPKNWKLYGTLDPTLGTIAWVLLDSKIAGTADQTYTGTPNNKQTTISFTPGAYKSYYWVVTHVYEPTVNPRSTLRLYEVIFYSSVTYCPTYAYITAAPSCTFCTQGKYSTVVDATVATGCTQQCPAGTYMPSQTAPTTCSYCPAGRYSINGLGAACTPCADGKYSPTVGAETIETCLPCPLGRGPSTDKSECAICAAGKYRGAAVNVCTDCPGSGTEMVSAAGSTVCIATCPSGTYLSGTTQCIPCLAGTAGAYTTGISCTACNANEFSGAGAATCLACPTGSYSPGASKACTYCELGKYVKSDDGPNTCRDCTAGTSTFSKGVITTVAGSATICTNCPAGKFSTDGTPCTDCPAGTINNNVGLSTCTQCTPGTYSEPGKTVCTPCSPEYSSGTGASTCKLPESYAQPW